MLNVIGYDARLLLLSLYLMTSIPSCCPCKHLPIQPGPSVKDSTTVNIKDSVAIHWIPVDFPIPVEVMREIVPAEDSSHLETSVAESTAYIDSLGRLHHDLRNKPGSLTTQVPMEEHYHSSDTTHEHGEIQPVIIEVDKPLSWWQSFEIGAFPWLVGAIVALSLLLVIVFKRK